MGTVTRKVTVLIMHDVLRRLTRYALRADRLRRDPTTYQGGEACP